MRAALPPSAAALLEHEAAGTTDAPEYQEAMNVFTNATSAASTRGRSASAFEKTGFEVYTYERKASSTSPQLKEWDIVSAGIDAPSSSAAATTGHPAITETVHRGIRGSEC